MSNTRVHDRHYPCSHRGYVLKEQIGRGTYGRVYKANVCKVAWTSFSEAAIKRGMSRKDLKCLEEAGFKKDPDRLLEVSNAEVRETIGVGSSADVEYVFKAIDSSRTETKEQVAIKILDEDCNDWEDVQREIHVMHDVHHVNIVTVHAAFLKNGAMDQIWVVMPLLAIGSLRILLKEIPEYERGIKDVKILASILKQALEALAYLHEDGRVHRDLKAANILMSEDGEVKLGDFGVTADSANTLRSFVGTASFMAPEVIERRRYCMKADIWSFGITALELAYGHAPYAYLDTRDCLRATLYHPSPSCKSYSRRHKSMPRSFQKVIEKCLHKDQSHRPTARQLLQMSFFKNAKGKKYIADHAIKHLMEKRKKKAADERKKMEKIGTENHKFWMIPVGSFILPKSQTRKSDGKKKGGFKLVRPRSKADKENVGTIKRSNTGRSKALKRWQWFLRHLESEGRSSDDGLFGELAIAQC
mmetsp:Transcript_2589/g.5120  ORF Transcript_2589/g.5120 Transcript_2589/m.5120 type:complete len:473 (-) Transcript_2589:151-1569(-)